MRLHADCCLVLHLLLSENDVLTTRLQTTQEKLGHSEQAQDVIRTEYMGAITELIQTVERAMDPHQQQQTVFANKIAAHASTSGGTSFSLSPQEATEMIVQTLSRKVEHLHLENSVLQQDLIATREHMEDLESLNQARLYTIDALEAQFRTKTRPRRIVGSSPEYSERKSPVYTVRDIVRTTSSSPAYHHRNYSRNDADVRNIVRATSSPPYHHKNSSRHDGDDIIVGYTPLLDETHIIESDSEMGEI
jgi:hypothetical protein